MRDPLEVDEVEGGGLLSGRTLHGVGPENQS